MINLLSTTSCHLCFGVEPLPNIRDGILVQRLVKTMRDVADMRRCQYVLQRPEGVRRRQRLNVEYVDRRAGDLLVMVSSSSSHRADLCRVDSTSSLTGSDALSGAPGFNTIVDETSLIPASPRINVSALVCTE